MLKVMGMGRRVRESWEHKVKTAGEFDEGREGEEGR